MIAARANAFQSKRHFAPVKVSRDRVIREVVGLRPYRPDGFVVDAERLGSKLLVHNYGHGGGGVTLSWGTASLAVDLLRDHLIARRAVRPTRFAVLGCGVSGLSTAILLQRRYQNGPGTVTIYAKDLPPNTTSNIAGASWAPTSVYENETGNFVDSVSAGLQDFESGISVARWSGVWRALDGHVRTDPERKLLPIENYPAATISIRKSKSTATRRTTSDSLTCGSIRRC